MSERYLTSSLNCDSRCSGRLPLVVFLERFFFFDAKEAIVFLDQRLVDSCSVETSRVTESLPSTTVTVDEETTGDDVPVVANLLECAKFFLAHEKFRQALCDLPKKQ